MDAACLDVALQHTCSAVCCRVLQRVEACCSLLQRVDVALQRTPPHHTSTLQHSCKNAHGARGFVAGTVPLDRVCSTERERKRERDRERVCEADLSTRLASSFRVMVWRGCVVWVCVLTHGVDTIVIPPPSLVFLFISLFCESVSHHLL